jgi:hypothetical protein
MKSYFLILKVTFSVSLIVLSIVVPVNCRLAGGVGGRNNRIADGVPLPPPTQPPPKLGVVQTADGVPLPPPTQPPPKIGVVLSVDGVPLPPPTQPPPKLGAVLTADGVPLPPPTQPPPKFLVAV